MRRTLGLVSCLLGGIAAGIARPAHADPDPDTEFHRGMCYAHVVRPARGYGSEASANSLARLGTLHVNWVSLTPFGFARDDTEPAVHLVGEAGPTYAQIGETDARVVGAARQAHAAGMRVMLKPHVWITPRAGSWRGSIHFEEAAGWDAWFASYERFILHYARMAEAQGMAALCIGTELITATRARPEAWRRLIAKIRAVYSGPLTYAAHYTDELEVIPFWGDLDFIGVNAYYPLTAAPEPTVADLEAAWAPIVTRLRAFAAEQGRPILFTEIGYRSVADAAGRPALWHSDAPLSAMTQARAYEAVFRAFAGEPWFRGVYWWKWQSDDDRYGGLADGDFTPQHKPAEFVLRTYYGRLKAGAPRGAPAEAGAD